MGIASFSSQMASHGTASMTVFERRIPRTAPPLPDVELFDLFGINEAIDIEPKYRPALESLRNELLDSFACLGSYSDQKLMEMDHE